MSEMSVAEELVQGWDDDEPVTEVVPPPIVGEVEQPEEEEVPAAPETEPDEVAEEEQGEDEDEETGDEGEEEDEEEAVASRAIEGFDLSDPDVIAYLAQYQDDPVKALRAAAELRRAFGRQGTELAQTRQRAQELEYQMNQARLLGGAAPLSQEQHEWAEGAAASASPGAYIQQAVNAGEFDLARAVCTYWAQSDPFNASRAGQLVDQTEGALQMQAQAPTEAPTEVILDALYANVPGMREWEPQMVSVFNNLGPNHHLVQESRSNNIDVAMRALINIFDIAKASTANVQERRSEIKKRARADADSAKAKAAVTSAASTSSTPKETPRADQLLMPGLTYGDLEREFAS